MRRSVFQLDGDGFDEGLPDVLADVGADDAAAARGIDPAAAVAAAELQLLMAEEVGRAWLFFCLAAFRCGWLQRHPRSAPSPAPFP